MDKCGICLKSADQLFETGKDGVYACFKCQPLVPEVMIGDNIVEVETKEVQPESIKEEEMSETSLECPFCNKCFEKNIQLQAHIRNHRAERRFVCTYCNKAFSQSNNLRAHLRIHTNERPYKCNECGKAFTQVTNLNNHVRLHTGERPFVCPEPGCNMAYAQVTNLNQHRKRHQSGRSVDSSYDCSVCGARFQQRNHLYNHRREEHGTTRATLKARFACQVCDQTFPTERLLRQHATSHESPAAPAPGGRRCVFSACGAVLPTARAYTQHLLTCHQLRLHPPRKHKILKDPLGLKEDSTYEVEVITTDHPVYVPTLKVQSLFQ